MSANADFFCWDNPYFDMSFLLNKSLNYEVNMGEYNYPIYTPNMLFADINIDKPVDNFEQIKDIKIKTELMNLATLVYNKFPISAIPNYSEESINFLKNLRLGFNIIRIQRLTKEQIKDVVTVEKEISGENFWTMDLLCSIVPADIEYVYSHRLLFKLTHPEYGVVDFNLDEFNLPVDFSGNT